MASNMRESGQQKRPSTIPDKVSNHQHDESSFLRRNLPIITDTVYIEKAKNIRVIKMMDNTSKELCILWQAPQVDDLIGISERANHSSQASSNIIRDPRSQLTSIQSPGLHIIAEQAILGAKLRDILRTRFNYKDPSSLKDKSIRRHQNEMLSMPGKREEEKLNVLPAQVEANPGDSKILDLGTRTLCKHYMNSIS